MWKQIGNEIAEDRETLIRVRDTIGARPNRLKYAVAWIAEKLGRTKLNGSLLHQSDLGELLEMEMLVIGVTGKLSLWKALDRLDDPRLRGFDFAELVTRAESQRQRLEQSRISLVPAALGK